jgi:hypothetical protein
MTAVPNNAAQNSPKTRKGTAAMPTTVTHNSTIKMGVSSTVSKAATAVRPGCVSSVCTHAISPLRNTRATHT